MPRSIPRFLFDASKRLPDKLAVVSNARSVTFSQLYDEAMATAECLRELGIQEGDRVGVCMEKSVDQVSVILGILFSNAVLVPILPRLKHTNIEHIIKNSGMVAMVTDSERLKEVCDFSDQVKLITGHGELQEDWPNLAYLRRHIQPRMFFDRIGVDNAAIIYSSGSTGRPKGILISHRNLADGAEIVSEYLHTGENERIGCVLSFNFDYGLNQVWQTLFKGCTLYLHDFVFPNDLFAFLAEEKITALPVMPVIISQMFNKRLKIATATYDFSCLRYICSTGGRLSEDMISDLQATFPLTKLYSMFGLTEAFRGTYLEPEKLTSHPHSIGKSIPGCHVMVLNKDGEECTPHEVGELVQRGATVTKGYWRDPENTAKVFRSHPKFPGETLIFSGDNAYTDEDGLLYFVGRIDEMIKTRGFRVSPTEVEVEVVRHPDITGAVALAVQNISIGEDIACAYTTEHGEALPEFKLKQYLKRNLPNHMVPTYLIHFDHFSVTGNEGKFDRKQVKQACFDHLGMTPNSSN